MIVDDDDEDAANTEAEEICSCIVESSLKFLNQLVWTLQVTC